MSDIKSRVVWIILGRLKEIVMIIIKFIPSITIPKELRHLVSLAI